MNPWLLFLRHFLQSDCSGPFYSQSLLRITFQQGIEQNHLSFLLFLRYWRSLTVSFRTKNRILQYHNPSLLFQPTLVRISRSSRIYLFLQADNLHSYRDLAVVTCKSVPRFLSQFLSSVLPSKVPKFLLAQFCFEFETCQE